MWGHTSKLLKSDHFFPTPAAPKAGPAQRKVGPRRRSAPRCDGRGPRGEERGRQIQGQRPSCCETRRRSPTRAIRCVSSPSPDPTCSPAAHPPHTHTPRVRPPSPSPAASLGNCGAGAGNPIELLGSEDEDEDDDEAVVIAAPSSSAHGSGAGATTDADSDEDVMMLESNTTNALVDMPHSRFHCKKHSFAANPSAFCGNCFCWVCDVPAAKCGAWSTHMHATDADEAWVKCKAAARRARTAAAAVPAAVARPTAATPPTPKMAPPAAAATADWGALMAERVRLASAASGSGCSVCKRDVLGENTRAAVFKVRAAARCSRRARLFCSLTRLCPPPPPHRLVCDASHRRCIGTGARSWPVLWTFLWPICCPSTCAFRGSTMDRRPASSASRCVASMPLQV